MATAVSLKFMKNGNGKRENSQMDMDSDDPEFVPLSKRINNLHLHQTSGQSSHHHQNLHQQQQHHHVQPHHPHGHDPCQLNGIIDNSGALNPNSHHSPHSPSGSHLQQDAPNFRMDGQGHSNRPSAQEIDFQMRNTCIASERRDSSNGTNSHGSGMNDCNMSKPHHSSGHGMIPGTMYSEHQQGVNINGLHGINYSPSMDASSNPHYYESNRELYLLYVERMNRTRQTLHPHFFETQ